MVLKLASRDCQPPGAAAHAPAPIPAAGTRKPRRRPERGCPCARADGGYRRSPARQNHAGGRARAAHWPAVKEGSPSRQNRASRLKVFFAKSSSLATVSAAMPGRQWLGRLRGSRYRAGDHHRGRNDEADHQRHRDYVKFFSASEVNSLRSAHEKQRSRHRHGEPVKEWRCEAGCDRAHGRSAPAPLARLAGAGLWPWPLGGRGRRRRGRGGPAGAPAHCKPQRFGVE